jgi:multicomponent Na+:H+ antiporter subunit D
VSSHALVPLLVVVPLIAAAVLAAGHEHIPRRVPDLVAVATGVFVTAGSCVLLAQSIHRDRIVYWFGGWKPTHGLALGVDFVVDPPAAALVALAGAVVTAVFLFSWRYFEEVGQLFHTLVLVFLAGLVGFAISGDLFNIFVWLELMSVAAYALCGYQVRHPEVLQGALNFAVLNSIAAFTVLLGIALIYGRTGALNLDQIGQSLARERPDGLVVVAFTLIAAGLLVKAGAVPFHFWLSDAYAVAPAPVGALFAGVMTDLAYHVFGRVYWSSFSGVLAAHTQAIRVSLLVVAVLTAVVGAVMCALQAELKRQLAFLSISQGGVLLAGIALMSARGLAASTLHTITTGLLRAALFLTIAAIAQSYGAGNELTLRGRGRRRSGVVLSVVFLPGALGLAATPGLGSFTSTALLLDSSPYPWLGPVLIATTALTAGTLLRAGARIFLGWGAADDPLLTRPSNPHDHGEEPGGTHGRRAADAAQRRWLLAPALLLIVLSCGAGMWPAMADHLISAAHGIQHPNRTAAQVLHGISPPHATASHYRPSASAWGYGAAAAVAAVLVAVLGLWWQRLVSGLRPVLLPAARALKAVHDGLMPEYVLWFVTGTSVLGTAWLMTLR